MAGETPELTLEQPPQDASTKKLGECLRRIGDELDNNMELQRCGSCNLGSIRGFMLPRELGTVYSGPPTTHLRYSALGKLYMVGHP